MDHIRRKIHKGLPSPEFLKTKFKPDSFATNFIKKTNIQIQNIFQKKDPRFVIIVGPCSVHNLAAFKEYARQFKKLASRVEKTCLMILRVFVEKPRTRIGWRGLVYDPDLDGSNNTERGLTLARKLLLKLAEKEIPCATEFVDSLMTHYFDDLISWGFIGARTSASQPHRQVASGLGFPIGFKNSIDGNINVAVDGVHSALSHHTYLGMDNDGKIASVSTFGNPLAHVVLRGSETATNFDEKSVQKTLQLLKSQKLNPQVLIDCSHGNCQKKNDNQKEAFESVIQQVIKGNKAILGLMLESYLQEGRQDLGENPSSLLYGLSITDPCINWEATEDLILSADALLASSLCLT